MSIGGRGKYFRSTSFDYEPQRRDTLKLKKRKNKCRSTLRSRKQSYKQKINLE